MAARWGSAVPQLVWSVLSRRARRWRQRERCEHDRGRDFTQAAGRDARASGQQPPPSTRQRRPQRDTARPARVTGDMRDVPDAGAGRERARERPMASPDVS
jgi:hypothetical protein